MSSKNTKKKRNLIQVFVMIFIPSAVLGITYSAIGLLQPPIPSILLFFLLALPLVFVFQMGAILNAGKKETGNYSLTSAFHHYEKMSNWKILFYGMGLFAFAGILSATIAPLENKLLAPLSNSLAQITPDYFHWNNIEYIQLYPGSTVLLTCIGYFLFNVFICPIVEELFFRGYLTHKISRFGDFSPLIITVLFSLYHFWLPFNNLFRIAAFFPAAYVAWKKKNIYIAMVFHCLCNLFSTVSFICAVYS